MGEDNAIPVLWSRLRPNDFKGRLADCPVALLPIGLCEPHGHIAAFGLDTIKAEYYCEAAARKAGGIVTPTQGYHIHECGFHAPWLEEVVGDTNPLMGGMPPHVVCYHFLYQLRAFANAGFRAVIVVSGHSGGSQNDLRRVGKAFEAACEIEVVIKSDPEWVDGTYEGDHAGKYEISQLMAIDPCLVDLSLLNEGDQPNSGGRFALGDDAGEASVEHGRQINAAIVGAICDQIADLRGRLEGVPFADPQISYEMAETIWQNVIEDGDNWYSNRTRPGQAMLSQESRWKSYEYSLIV